MNKVQTILYRGRRVDVRVVSEINATNLDGMDFILRDAAGNYYFRRELYDEDSGYYHALRHKRQCHYRCYVHRISLVAVILWQLHLHTSCGVRGEAAALLRKEAA